MGGFPAEMMTQGGGGGGDVIWAWVLFGRCWHQAQGCTLQRGEWERGKVSS